MKRCVVVAMIGQEPMSLDHSEFVRLSRIAESLSRSDPELARKRAAPMRRSSLWTVLCYLVLSMFGFVALAVVAIGDTTSLGNSIEKSALHGNERTAADLRPQVHDQVDEHSSGHRALLMGLPVNYGAADTR
ncbi:DUF3040 domain-containing protein [Pseudonocardia sp. CA-142604]|uniref:DUF3040 domain-containing protein n=1 Tax=Pseudonocardia sp. CA-142604 TaxID=3240024 RepID=UPI003D89BC0E